MEASKQVVISKGFHKGKDIIWLEFYQRHDWLNKVKQLDQAKYSATHKQWYIPYDKLTWNDFLKLQIPYTITGTHEGNDTTPGEKAISNHDNTSISHQKMEESANPHIAKEVAGIHGDISISWTGKGFVISIPYQNVFINDVKKLEGAYWNQKVKKWMAKNTISNLDKIQSMWNLYDEVELQKWRDKIMLSHHPCKIQLYMSPQYAEMVCVKILGYGANHHIVKRISGRKYLSQEKVYLIPSQKEIVDQVIAAYEDIGYPIENRISIYNKSDNNRNKSAVSQVEHFLKRMPPKWYSTLKRYTDTMLAQKYSPNTITDYGGSMVRVMDWCKVDDMSNLTIKGINEFLQYLANQSVSSSMLNTIHSAVKIFLTKVSDKEWPEMSKLERPKEADKIPKILSENEILAIIDNINNVKHLTVVAILYGSGIRRGEVINIKIEDVYWDRNQIVIRNGKGNKDRIVNLSQMAKEMLEIYFHEYKPIIYLFEGQKDATPYSPSSVAAIVRRAARKANISKKVTPHMMRHSFATHSMDAGTAMPKIQALLGHKDIKTTMIYTHLSKDDIREIESPLDRLMKRKRGNRNKKE